MHTPRDDQLNILVIDDDASMRELLVEIITRYDHQVVPAASSEEALTLLPYWTFQVAFLDHKLPGLEGLLLGEYLRKHNPDLTIALVTGQDDPKLERRSRDLSIRFISKPFQVAEIVAVIESHQAEAQEREERRRKHENPFHAPPISEYVSELMDCYAIPNVPARIEARLIETIKHCLSDLRAGNRYNERDRVVALSGLLTARVLGVSLPKTSEGRTLYEEYDQIMGDNGRRTEFGDA
jgi:CheY-like chemotaxis protein